MAGQATETQVNLKINGESATNTLKAMGGEVRGLRKELASIPVDTQAFIDKAKELDVAENRLLAAKNAAKEVRTQMSALGDDTKKARADLLSLSPVGGMLQNLQQGFTTVRTAIGANITGMNLLKVAIAATGIGALALAVGALYSYFVKTDEGAKKLEGALNALGNIVDVLGSRLRTLFTNPTQFFKGMGDDLKAAVTSGIELAEVMDEIDEKQRALNLEAAKSEVRLNQLLLQSKNRQLDEKTRLDLLNQASKIEETIHAKRMEMADDEIKAAQLVIDQANRSGTVSDEQLQKLTDAQIKKLGLENDSISLQEKINNRQAALEDELQQEKTKLAEAGKKKREKLEAERLKNAEIQAKNELEIYRKVSDLTIANIVDENERKRVTILNNYKRALEDAFLNGQQSKDLELQLLIQRDNDLTALELEIEAKKTAKKAADDQKKAEEKLAILDFEKEQLISDVEFSTVTAQEKEDLIYEIERSAAEKKLALLQSSGTATELEIKKQQAVITNLDRENNQKKIDNTKRTEETKLGLERAAFSATAGIFGGVADLLSKDEESKRKHSGVIKAFKLAELFTSSVAEIAGIWENANKNPINALIPGWGPAFAGVQTAFVAARLALGASQISSTKFKKGGMLQPRGGVLNQGSYHEQGGIQMYDGATGQHLGEAERDEHMMILSRPFYQNNKEAVDMMLDASMYGGGKKVFRNGGFFEDGGMVNTPSAPASQNAEANATNAAAMQQVSLLKSIDAKLSSPNYVRAYVTYEQLAQVMEEGNSIKNEADA
jgi:hypothetical protein